MYNSFNKNVIPEMKMKFNFKNVNEKWKAYALGGSVCVVLFVILTNLGKVLSAIGSFLGIFSSVFIGFIIAYIINPLAVWFEKKVFFKLPSKKVRWVLSVVLAFLIILLFLSFILYMLIPQIVDNVGSLVANLDTYYQRLENAAKNIDGIFKPMAMHLVETLSGSSGVVSNIGQFLTGNLTSILSKTTKIGSKAVNWLIGLILAIYFLLAKEAILNTFARFFALAMSDLKYYRSRLILQKFNSIFSTYIAFELLDALIIGLLNLAFMLATNMPDAAFISVAIGITNLVPTFGPIIGAAIGVFILLLLKPAAILPLLIFTVVLQTADAYLIKPKLFGNALNVPGVLILVSIIVFGKLFGIMGMLIAIPCAAILVFLYEEALIPRLKLKREMAEYVEEQKKNQNTENK